MYENDNINRKKMNEIVTSIATGLLQSEIYFKTNSDFAAQKYEEIDSFIYIESNQEEILDSLGISRKEVDLFRAEVTQIKKKLCSQFNCSFEEIAEFLKR